jgi:hypothetical protein
MASSASRFACAVVITPGRVPIHILMVAIILLTMRRIAATLAVALLKNWDFLEGYTLHR